MDGLNRPGGSLDTTGENSMNEFEKDGYRYTPEESVTRIKTKGVIWSRWKILREPGSGQAFDGRVFVPDDEQFRSEIVARFSDD
jgi:hypothetical protein